MYFNFLSFPQKLTPQPDHWARNECFSAIEKIKDFVSC